MAAWRCTFRPFCTFETDDRLEWFRHLEMHHAAENDEAQAKWQAKRAADQAAWLVAHDLEDIADVMPVLSELRREAMRYVAEHYSYDEHGQADEKLWHEALASILGTEPSSDFSPERIFAAWYELVTVAHEVPHELFTEGRSARSAVALTFGDVARARRPEVRQMLAQMEQLVASDKLPTDDEAKALLPFQAEAVGNWLVNTRGGLWDSTAAFLDDETDETNEQERRPPWLEEP